MLKQILYSAAAVIFFVTSVFAFVEMPRASAVNNMIFPVLGGGRYSNDFTASRPSGQHNATDILAPTHTPLVSPVDGTIYYVMYPEPSWGYSLGIRDADGYEFNFLHLNNDSDGTDDDKGGAMKAYAVDMKVGNKVAKGQHIGWVGDSGHSNNVPHLHFEMYEPNGGVINPYEFLRQSTVIYQPTALYPAQPGESLPYGASVRSTVQVAAGNLDADPASEYVTGTGAGSTPQVRIFNNDLSFNDFGFFAYGENYRGGVNVAIGDVDGDGQDEIITGTGQGNTSHVRIFERNGQPIGGFFAYGSHLTGVNVATADVDNDGADEIITGTTSGNTTHVKSFELNGQMTNSFFAYPGHAVGVNVAGGDVDGDGQDEIVTSPSIASSHVKIFKPNGEQESDFSAYSGFYGGSRVAVGNVRASDVKEEIMTAPSSKGGPNIRMFDETGRLIVWKDVYEKWWEGGYDVAATDGFSVVGTGGNRRSSVRLGPN